MGLHFTHLFESTVGDLYPMSIILTIMALYEDRKDYIIQVKHLLCSHFYFSLGVLLTFENWG
jgi:hypothetical protein